MQSGINPEIWAVYPLVLALNQKVLAFFHEFTFPDKFRTLRYPRTTLSNNKKTLQLGFELKGFQILVRWTATHLKLSSPVH
jgi:hypothetical protein